MRSWFLTSAVMLLAVVACRKDDPQPPEPPLPPVVEEPATPYTLVLPTQLPQNVVIPANNPL
ncbi:MAG TPA: hypothetical protein VK364_04550, partial [Hymenobacter sp.]|nr:hypothetical protein [Hymenobacter sp.]